MENYDPRRRQASEGRERYPQSGEDRGREQWRPHDDERSRRRASEQRGWLDYDPDYGRGEDRFADRADPADRASREEQRYGQERSSFSPDWSREGAEPLRLARTSGRASLYGSLTLPPNAASPTTTQSG